MKKYFISAVLIFLGTNFIFAQTQKIGYIDSQVILAQLPEAIKAQGDLDALTNQWSAHLDTMRANYQQDLADYQKKANTMTDKEKLKVQQRLVDEENNIVNYNKEKFAQGTGEIYKKQDEIFGPVKTKIYQAIKDVAKKEDMKFVFDKAGDVVLLYADPQFDLTYKVLDRLKTGGK
ncbi:MAG: OmpH family outer membrane protein [Bacteroidetes bacterium]|nr:OmpH family outer membrane protein [Bacteroidota bacterium]